MLKICGSFDEMRACREDTFRRQISSLALLIPTSTSTALKGRRATDRPIRVGKLTFGARAQQGAAWRRHGRPHVPRSPPRFIPALRLTRFSTSWILPACCDNVAASCSFKITASFYVYMYLFIPYIPSSRRGPCLRFLVLEFTPGQSDLP